MLRVFFGLELPAAQRSALAVQQFLLPLPRLTDPVDFHLTLAFLGELPEPQVQAAHEAAEGLGAAPFDLTIAGLGTFGGEKARVAWAGVMPSEPLMRLQSRLTQALRLSGLDPEARRFTPHVTLGRFPPPPPDQAMRLERAVAETPLRLAPFRVDSFALFQSFTGVKTGKYPVLQRYPLAG